MLYDLFSLELAAGEDLAYGDADPRLLQIVEKGNKYIKQFISLRLTWAELLERLECLGIDVDQYQEDIRLNHLDAGLAWLS
jgi:hypothetical protein